MAPKSATSSTKSDSRPRAFATFRVAGDDLAPDEVTRLLEVRPTEAHVKGETYSTGRSTVVAGTGIWLFSTDRVLLSASLPDHVRLVSLIFGLQDPYAASAAVAQHGIGKLPRLAEFLRGRRVAASATFFWHGAAHAAAPALPEGLIELLQLVPITVETDFDRDEPVASRRTKAA